MDHEQRALLRREGRWGLAEPSMTRHLDWSGGAGGSVHASTRVPYHLLLSVGQRQWSEEQRRRPEPSLEEGRGKGDWATAHVSLAVSLPDPVCQASYCVACPGPRARGLKSETALALQT